MKLSAQKSYYKFGSRHWWLNGKYKLILNLAYFYLTFGNCKKILDAGCGTGNLLVRLDKRNKLIGSDYSLEALSFAKKRGETKLFCCNSVDLPIKDEIFDIVFAIDVIEHIEDHEKVISEIHRILVPGGHLILTVPAFSSLWGKHDEIFGHLRRYKVSEIRNLLDRSHFFIKKLSYFQMVFYIPLFLMRKIKRIIRSTADDFQELPVWLNTLLTWIVYGEVWLLKKFNLPFGATIINISMKKNK